MSKISGTDTENILVSNWYTMSSNWRGSRDLARVLSKKDSFFLISNDYFSQTKVILKEVLSISTNIWSSQEVTRVHSHPDSFRFVDWYLWTACTLGHWTYCHSWGSKAVNDWLILLLSDCMYKCMYNLGYLIEDFNTNMLDNFTATKNDMNTVKFFKFELSLHFSKQLINLCVICSHKCNLFQLVVLNSAVLTRLWLQLWMDCSPTHPLILSTRSPQRMSLPLQPKCHL